MKLTVDMKLNLKIPEVQKAMNDATRKGLRDTIVAIANDAVQGSPVLTGNNRRSIKYEVSGFGLGEGIVSPNKSEAATYSTSGYGGFLETGTSRMAARPYFRPALDKHRDELGPNIRKYVG